MRGELAPPPDDERIVAGVELARHDAGLVGAVERTVGQRLHPHREGTCLREGVGIDRRHRTGMHEIVGVVECQRVMMALTDIRRIHQQERRVVVTHGNQIPAQRHHP